MEKRTQMDADGADERAAADPLKKFVPIFCSLCVDLRTSASSASAFDIESGLSGRTAGFAQDEKELEQRHRISIDRRAQVAALGNWKPLCEKARDLAQLTGMARLEQAVPAPASLDTIDGTRRGADDRQLPFRSRTEPLAPPRRVRGQLRRRR